MKLSALRAALTEAGIEEAGQEARLLFSHFSGRPLSSLFGTDPDCTMPGLTVALNRRLRREPLAYILGQADFYRQRYAVGPGCLVPRPDTERLVELAVSLLPAGAHFADLCTGIGTIALSILCERSDTTAAGFELSKEALGYAGLNREKYGMNARFSLIRADLLTSEPDGEFDAILSNPPYIPQKDLASLAPEVGYEPPGALDGGEDGMLFYRRFLTFTPHLREGGFFLFECGYDEEEKMAELAEEKQFSFTPYRDYGGNFRVALLRRTPR